jgi:Tol biopolymer transport system component
MMNNVQNSLVAALVLILLITGPVIAQTEPEELLESGVYMEEVEGNLEGAIAVFKRIIDEFPSNRSVAARALLHLGSSYEKLGNQRAEQAYQRLISEFGDQEVMVSEARLRLQRIRYQELASGDQSKGAGPTYRLALDEDVPRLDINHRQYDMSPDGSHIVYQGGDGLYISDASGTLKTLLVEHDSDPNAWQFIWPMAGIPRWSPDGSRIAYTAVKPRIPDGDPNDLITTIFLVDAKGGQPHPIVPVLEPQPRGGLCWTSDGKSITYLSLEGVRTIDLEGKVLEAYSVEEKWSTRIIDYSPNGRWLTMRRKSDESSGNNADTDLFLLPAGGGETVQLTDHPGFDGQPAWSRDGRSIYFVSGRSGSWNIWKLAINPDSGIPAGNPEQVTFFRDARIMYPRVTGRGDRIAFCLDKNKNSIHVADVTQPEIYNTLARGVSPLLSPDGKTVYYVGEGPDQQGIFALSTEGGMPQKLTLAAPVSGLKDLSPDGTELAYFGVEDDVGGLYTLPTGSGKPRLILRNECNECCTTPRWSPDGRLLAYAYGDGLFVVPSAGGDPRKLATLANWEAWTIRWSPNGEYIAALGYQEGEDNNAVFVIPVTDGEARLVSTFADYKEGLEWHPDGQSLTYHLSRPKSETYRTYLDGRPPEFFLDKSDAWDYTGQWSPDGKRYFLKNSKCKKWYLDVYDVDTGEFTPFAENASLPVWSADKKTVAWTTEQTIRQIWLMENFR